MDGMRARRPSYKSQPSMAPKAVREEFKADIEWIEDSSNRYIHVQLPGFRREDLKVQLDSAGKLFVKGSRQVSDNKQLDVSQSFDVPKDTIIEKIGGRFEDGRLILTMPRRVPEEQEAKQKPVYDEKVKEPVQDERQKTAVSEENVEEPVPDEKPKAAEVRKEEEPIKEEVRTGEEEKKDEPMREEKPTSHEEKREAHVREEKPTSLEEMKDEPMPEEKTATAEVKQNELGHGEKTRSTENAIQDETPKTAGEKKDGGQEGEEKMKRSDDKDETAEQEKPECAEERTHGDQIQTEEAVSAAMENGKDAIEKVKSKMKEICSDTQKGIRKRLSAWRGAEGRGLDSGSLDDMLEKMNKNRNVIAVAVVAFSVGFYVSHKLRTRG